MSRRLAFGGEKRTPAVTFLREAFTGMRLPFLMCLFALGAAAIHAQDHGSITANPFSTPEDATSGARSFKSQCAACHGPDASGGAVGPSLVSGTFKHGGSDEALFGVINKGVPGTAMVGFNLNGREIWQLIAYLRSANIAKSAGQATGDPAKGVGIFEANGCAGCHTVGFTGGFAGPDLSEIGSHRSLPQLETALLDPDAEVAADFWSVRGKTKSGETVTGIRMNEDMDSVQIRDPQGHLRTLRKAGMASWEIVRKSPMPSFKSKLSSGDLQDLVAYLASLRAPAVQEGKEQ